MKTRLEELASIVIDTAMGVHIDVGPGLRESVYEGLLAQRLTKHGLKIFAPLREIDSPLV
ncbi:MAG: GxxExxY protein [Sphingorhabdus sp.]